MTKFLSKKAGRRFILFILVNFVLYIIACFVLIYWPIPSKKDIENYDYSSIRTNAKYVSAGEENWIQTRSGDKLFSRIFPGENKIVLILIHGSGSESRYLSNLALSLARNNAATVITPDLRGHGKSAEIKGDISYIGQLEEDIEDMILYAKKELFAKEIILAGHSSGGGLVLRYIGNSKLTKADKAIMLSPYLGHDAPTVKPNSGDWVTVAVKRWVGLSMLNYLGISYFNNLPVLFFNRPQSVNDKLQLPSYSYRMAVNFAPKDYKKDIPNIETPSLVLVGKNDESFYPDQFKTVFEPAGNGVEVKLSKNVKHLDIVSSEETIKEMMKWIKE